MKIYKVNKKILHWKEMNQIQYKWKLPILVDNKYNVIAGNSLKDSLDDIVYVIILDDNPLLFENLFYVETKIVEENNPKRIGTLDIELREYFNELRKKPVEKISLFDNKKCYECISEENYILRRDRFVSHGRKEEKDLGQLNLFVLDDNEEKDLLLDIKIDLEILKELL